MPRAFKWSNKVYDETLVDPPRLGDYIIESNGTRVIINMTPINYGWRHYDFTLLAPWGKLIYVTYSIPALVEVKDAPIG